MFENLRKSRSLLMGLAILGVIFYHAPFIIHQNWLKMIHDNLYCGVELFLFFSGIGACHSIASRGGKGYLLQRCKRILPGLLLVLIPWSLAVWLTGLVDFKGFLGCVTLVGWYLGQDLFLNWYFSAVWVYFLLAVPFYYLFKKFRYPVVLWLILLPLSYLCYHYCDFPQMLLAVARLPIFFTGMLFGRLEQTGFKRTGILRVILAAAMVVGLLWVREVYWTYGIYYGYALGIWWYPFLLVIPGFAVFTADIAAWLRKKGNKVVNFLLHLPEIPGTASAELLAVHLAVYKLVENLAPPSLGNPAWVGIMLGCILLGILYQRFVVAKLPIK